MRAFGQSGQAMQDGSIPFGRERQNPRLIRPVRERAKRRASEREGSCCSHQSWRDGSKAGFEDMKMVGPACIRTCGGPLPKRDRMGGGRNLTQITGKQGLNFD